MPITALPTPPSRSDPANFAERADDFLGALPNFVTQVNATAVTIQNSDTASAAAALSASNSNAAAMATANFKGAWSSLTGALAIPASVSHSSKIWVLVSSVADVTTVVPGVSSNWIDITPFYYPTDALNLPSGPTASRPVSATIGAVRWNTTYQAAEIYTNYGWRLHTTKEYPVNGGSSVSGVAWVVPDIMQEFQLSLNRITTDGSANIALTMSSPIGGATVYEGFGHLITSAGSSTFTGAVTTYIPLKPNSAGSLLTGILTGRCIDPTNNTWVIAGTFSTAGGSTRTYGYVNLGAGRYPDGIGFAPTTDLFDNDGISSKIKLIVR
jgi:hypothetical protein